MPSRSAPPHELTEELEKLALENLLRLYGDLNWRHFQKSLRMPTFEVSRADSFYGRWNSSTRTLSISHALLFDHPWPSVVEVMKHEMAHQFVDEVLRCSHEAAHGPAFRSVCVDLGIDARASGLPVADEGTEADVRIIERISRLLRLASSPNQHEAEAATVAARKLMLKHNVEAQRAEQRYAFRVLGQPTKRITQAARILAAILRDHFFVRVIWVGLHVTRSGKSGTALEVSGSTANLAIAEYVFEFLNHTAEELWRAHKREKGISKDRERRAFLTGVMDGFRLKLMRESQVNAQETGLVWVGDADLEAFYRSRHPHIRTSARSQAVYGEAFGEGRAAGERIVLRRAVENATTARGRLLGSGS